MFSRDITPITAIMDGDLSLSQSLGGLRIANPDDSSLESSEDAAVQSLAAGAFAHPEWMSPPLSDFAPPAQSQPAAAMEQDAQRHSPSATMYGLAARPSHESEASVPHAYQDVLKHQPSQQTPTYTPNQAVSSHGSARPASVYRKSSTSTNPIRESPYRIRTDSAASSAAESVARVESRGGSAAYQAGVPVQDSNHSDRSYHTVQFPATNGSKVLRQSSRANARARGISPLPGSPYAIENGPPASSEEWQDRGAAVSVRQEIDANGKPVARYIKKGVRDFSFGQTLGEGSYSTVVLATDRQTLKEYAVKILDKRHIIKEKKVKYVNIEKDTLNRLTEHPGIVRLYYTFQDERSLYFVLDLCKGGELLGVLKRMSTFDEECTRFYGAQILDTIDYMHKCCVIHRDLKPENVLLDSHMHIKITDFGTAKILKGQKRTDISSAGIPELDATELPEEERANSFVGTAEYVSPELLTDKNACKASDLWAFGCIIYQLLAGRPPFKAANEYQTFQKIVALEYEFPIGFPTVARDLVERLLVLDPTRRLQIEHIKNHQFFEGMTWGPELWKQKAPRLKAYVPPPREPIKLNGDPNGDSFPPAISTAPSNVPGIASARALPRVVTQLPPPSQLDIEWSPVLTKANERILKLGNLVVVSSPAPQGSSNGEGEAPKKFSRFFGGGGVKRRQRLVMVTSAARIVVVAAGGDEKKAKLEISLLAPGTQYRSITDSKGFSCWVVDTRDKRITFEDPKPSSNNIGTMALSTQEWLDTLDRAREIASSQSSGPYSADDTFRESGFSSHANTLDRSSEIQSETQQTGRSTLIKQQPGDSESVVGKKRFSKRHSKNGLAAVF